jgi:hypothetical protein
MMYQITCSIGEQWDEESLIWDWQESECPTQASGSSASVASVTVPSDIARISPLLQYSCETGTVGFWYDRSVGS